MRAVLLAYSVHPAALGRETRQDDLHTSHQHDEHRERYRRRCALVRQQVGANECTAELNWFGQGPADSCTGSQPCDLGAIVLTFKPAPCLSGLGRYAKLSIATLRCHSLARIGRLEADFGASAASRCMKASGNITQWVMPPRQAVLSLSANCTAA